MIEPKSNSFQAFYHRRAIQIAAAVVIAIPLSYMLGRYATGASLSSAWHLVATAATAVSLGALLGIPIGLFYGSLKSQTPGPIIHHFHPDFVNQQDKILGQIKSELERDHSLLRTRIGDTTSTSSVRYDTSFWAAAKASGQLFVMQEPGLLATLARTYYWLEEANRLESLAFELHFNPPANNPAAPAQLLAQVRLLDGVLDSSINAATAAIAAQVAVDQATPKDQAPEPVMAYRDVTGETEAPDSSSTT